VALTFDDGPDPASTPQFLAVLDELNIKATFFMLGSMVRQAPTLAAEVAAAGHEIAVHADDHTSMLKRSTQSAIDNVRRAHGDIAEITGTEPRFFRPPYGLCSWGALRAARECGLQTVLWTAWGRDWRANATPDTVVADLLKGQLDGGTMLLHDSDCTSAPLSWRNTIAALPLLVDVLRIAFFGAAVVYTGLMMERMGSLKMTIVDLPMNIVYGVCLFGLAMMALRSLWVIKVHWQRGYSVLERPESTMEDR
jgi:peptidoglycan/xylan/chitin deacetylase (PgdA/CDA1 family)